MFSSPDLRKENPGIKVNAVSHRVGGPPRQRSSSARSPTRCRMWRVWISRGCPNSRRWAFSPRSTRKWPISVPSPPICLESAMSTGFVSGHYYAMALNTDTKILFYNEKALEEAGVAVPATMDEFVKAVAAVSGKNSAGQTVWGLNEPALAGSTSCRTSGRTAARSRTRTIPRPAATSTAKRRSPPCRCSRIWRRTASFPATTAVISRSTDGFGTGREHSSLLEGPWKTARSLAGAYPDTGSRQLPAARRGSRIDSSVLGGEDIAMFNGSHKDAAWKFMQFMTSPFAEEEMAKCGQIPVNKTALESETVKNASFAPFLEAITTAKARPAVSCIVGDRRRAHDRHDEDPRQRRRGCEGDELDALAVTIDGLLASTQHNPSYSATVLSCPAASGGGATVFRRGGMAMMLRSGRNKAQVRGAARPGDHRFRALSRSIRSVQSSSL